MRTEFPKSAVAARHETMHLTRYSWAYHQLVDFLENDSVLLVNCSGQVSAVCCLSTAAVKFLKTLAAAADFSMA
eukprot:2478938-Pleurochrysis_carterae.AAC.1